MNHEKLKLSLIIFIEKINSGIFSYEDVVTFLSSIRFEDEVFYRGISANNNYLLDIAHIAAHQLKDRGLIVKKLKGFKIISQYIEEANLNKTKNLTIDKFPKETFESICFIYNDDLKSYYKKQNNFYHLKQKRSYIRKAKRILRDVFCTYDMLYPLVSRDDLYEDFIKCLNFFRGKLSLPEINKINENKKNELLLCFSYVLFKSKIYVGEGEEYIEPDFSISSGKLNLMCKLNFVKHPMINMTVGNGVGLSACVINLGIDAESVNFDPDFENIIIQRDDDNDLVFRDL